MRLTKIYTKVGDKGQTLLVNGQKVDKDHPRVEAYGTVDELNAHLGMLRDLIRPADHELRQQLDESLYRIQNELFDLGSELATPAEAMSDKQPIIKTADIERLETEIDQINGQMPPLENFVLPGGHPANSQAHICRTICRRAERDLVKLRRHDKAVRAETQTYINRLSDWLFVTSRVVSRIFDCSEVLWDQERRVRN
jgi:cob(I)alamin adenosyltransferase